MSLGKMDDIKEHPEADEILRQAEYYFSDENLLTDLFLKKQMMEYGDGKVLLKEILRFPKMRRFKPKTKVIATLKQSAILKISEDNVWISRLVPFMGWEDSDVGEDYDDKERQWKARDQASQPKKKVAGVGMGAKLAAGMHKPTGFEDTFVDGPITPAEFAEERKTYDPDEQSVHERLNIAIHRYTNRRKFHQNYALIFSEFMKYGGVEGRGGEFQGGKIPEEELAEMDAGSLAWAKSSYDVGNDKDSEDGVWALDFEGVAKGFLSSKLPQLVPSREFPLAIRILTNFYNYLLVHDVFHSEEEADIVASIRACIALCNLAAKELPKTSESGRRLPGDFNVAASVLSCGHHEPLWTGDQDWANETVENTFNDEIWGSGAPAGMPRTTAKIILTMGIAAYGNDKLFGALQSFDGRLRCIEEKEYFGLEVKEIVVASEETHKLYSSDQEVQKKVNAKVLGRLICEEWSVPLFETWDLPPSKEGNARNCARYEFWVEDEVLKSMYSGMKMEATLRNLALGPEDDAPAFWTIDTVSQTFCSFYTYLPNELMEKPLKPARWLIEGDNQGAEAGKGNQDDDDF